MAARLVAVVGMWNAALAASRCDCRLTTCDNLRLDDIPRLWSHWAGFCPRVALVLTVAGIDWIMIESVSTHWGLSLIGQLGMECSQLSLVYWVTALI